MWPHIISVAVGIWLMIAPARLNLSSDNSNYERILGPVIAALALIAMAQVTRPVRWIIFSIGLWLIVGPFILGFATLQRTAARNEIIAGAIIAVTSLFRGRVRHSQGGGWTSLWKSENQ